jgi:hypothetical protein
MGKDNQGFVFGGVTFGMALDCTSKDIQLAVGHMKMENS